MRSHRQRVVVVVAVGAFVVGCSGSGESGSQEGLPVGSGGRASSVPEGADTAVRNASGSEYLGDYQFDDGETQVSVAVADGVRTIRSNELPDHATGAFPNAENPSPITAHDLKVSFPIHADWTGSKTPTSLSGVALNGVKFDPGPVATIDCSSGESYGIEAIGGDYDLGLDFNNAHVQSDGEYHYHGIAQLLVDAVGGEQDLVLVGFAPDGYLIYYSKSGAYRPGYKLSTTPRTGKQCEWEGHGQVDQLHRSLPDGSFTSDWVWDVTNGDLDECNGTTVNGQYAYFVTDGFPFVGRCLNGRFDTTNFGDELSAG